MQSSHRSYACARTEFDRGAQKARTGIVGRHDDAHQRLGVPRPGGFPHPVQVRRAGIVVLAEPIPAKVGRIELRSARQQQTGIGPRLPGGRHHRCERPTPRRSLRCGLAGGRRDETSQPVRATPLQTDEHVDAVLRETQIQVRVLQLLLEAAHILRGGITGSVRVRVRPGRVNRGCVCDRRLTAGGLRRTAPRAFPSYAFTWP